MPIRAPSDFLRRRTKPRRSVRYLTPGPGEFVAAGVDAGVRRPVIHAPDTGPIDGDAVPPRGWAALLSLGRVTTV
ncbi:hypothetical protein BGZ61DRAFT_437533 [Ilyonectria robusta]|uniref:uncharacterized protein n=1 Tax=Ilyonectria robusta TaxID=1079257 RepID=UPI001E8EEC5B|nr:uncharacterized protein BGZ61DRAFT_437533 [Ilyonectria robusta]KAH8737041.1 hypothetical protein BGZ61DRAFT_437533 [Ilyonectria robusta]